MSAQNRFTSLSALKQLLPQSTNDHGVPVQKTNTHDGKGQRVRIVLDTKGRKGKVVTLVQGLQRNPKTLEEIARQLKQYCGAGGTVRQLTIEIQGDQRVKVGEKLKEMNYTVF